MAHSPNLIRQGLFKETCSAQQNSLGISLLISVSRCISAGEASELSNPPDSVRILYDDSAGLVATCRGALMYAANQVPHNRVLNCSSVMLDAKLR